MNASSEGIPFVLAGSIRDDGPLPDVITDSMEAQDRMRAHIQGCSMVLMVATLLHSVAVGNRLPSYCQDHLRGYQPLIPDETDGPGYDAGHRGGERCRDISPAPRKADSRSRVAAASGSAACRTVSRVRARSPILPCMHTLFQRPPPEADDLPSGCTPGVR